MKKILKTFFLFSLLAAALVSCKKDENKVYFEGGSSPVLKSTVTTDTLPLTYITAGSTLMNLSWTNPGYKFNTGISSQNVSYQIEIDTAGSNFTNPNRQTISVSQDLSRPFGVSEFNGYLLNQLVLAPSMPHNLEIRVSSFLGVNTGLAHSNVLKYVAVPYTIPPVVTPPASGTLFIVGSAVAVSGWNNPISPSSQVPIQEFQQMSPTLYQIKIDLIGGGEYKFIAVNGSWNNQWSTKNADDPNELYGGDFIFNGQNVLAPPASGNYTITVDFQRGKFTVTKN